MNTCVEVYGSVCGTSECVCGHKWVCMWLCECTHICHTHKYLHGKVEAKQTKESLIFSVFDMDNCESLERFKKRCKWLIKLTQSEKQLIHLKLISWYFPVKKPYNMKQKVIPLSVFPHHLFIFLLVAKAKNVEVISATFPLHISPSTYIQNLTTSSPTIFLAHSPSSLFWIIGLAS